MRHILRVLSWAWFAVALPVLAVDTSDWDWGGIVEMENTVITPPPRVPAPPPVPQPLPIAKPDVTAPFKPAVALFPSMPEFTVIPAIKDKTMYPCSNCHRWAKSNTIMRKLLAPHDNFSLQHGLSERGKLWCFTCHDLTGNSGDGSLRTLDGAQLDYDESYVLCTQCHASQGRDWAFGVHGKRLKTWQGPRQIYNCTACHYQHSPAITPRLAKPGPSKPVN